MISSNEVVVVVGSSLLGVTLQLTWLLNVITLAVLCGLLIRKCMKQKKVMKARAAKHGRN